MVHLNTCLFIIIWAKTLSCSHQLEDQTVQLVISPKSGDAAGLIMKMVIIMLIVMISLIKMLIMIISLITMMIIMISLITMVTMKNMMIIEDREMLQV